MECLEPSICLYSDSDKPIGFEMPWFKAFQADGAAAGFDVEVGRRLRSLLEGVEGLDTVRQEVFPFPPKMQLGREKQAGLIEQLPDFFTLVVTKLCGMTRSEDEVKELVKDMRTRWEGEFDKGDHFDMFAVYGQKRS